MHRPGKTERAMSVKKGGFAIRILHGESPFSSGITESARDVAVNVK
jgi:hypothetical protein